MSTISVVIPALDERAAIGATLAALVVQHPHEIVVVDGGSTDGTQDFARRCANDLGVAERVRVIDGPRGRASQMNAGAAIASGDTLLFLHADTLLPPGALAAIARTQAPWGGFRHAFDGADWRLRLVSLLHNFRCGRTHVFYGDQAMFVRRAAFDAAGGFPVTRHLEDVMLSERLLAIAPPAFLPLTVVASSRKFVQAGVWTSLARCLRIVAGYRFGPRDAWVPVAERFFRDVR